MSATVASSPAPIAICSSTVKKTGLPCGNKAKVDGKCGVHNRTKKVSAPVGPIQKCCATVKKTGLPCENKAKVDGKCGVHNRTKKVSAKTKNEPIVNVVVSDTETEFENTVAIFTDRILQEAIACC